MEKKMMAKPDMIHLNLRSIQYLNCKTLLFEKVNEDENRQFTCNEI